MNLRVPIRVPGSLRFRVLLVIGLATLPALVYILYTASRTQRQARRAVEAQARYLARLASRQHAAQISSARALLTAIRGIPVDWRERSTPCPDFFPALRASVPHLANLGILGVDGRVTCSVVPSPEHVDMSATPAFQRALTSRGVEVGEYRIGLIVRRPVLVMAHAIRDPAGTVREVSFAALELDWLGHLAAETEMPAGSVFSIVDGAGRILARSLEPARHLGEASPAALAAAIAAHPDGVLDVDDVDGRRRLSAYVPLEGVPGVFVSAGIPHDVAFAAAERALHVQLGALALLIAFVGLAGWGGTTLAVLRPISELSRATRALTAGDLAVRAPERSGQGELGDLARSFNLMADALESRASQAVRTQAALQEGEERLRALSHRLQSVREAECERIARDLHDQLGQDLTALELDLRWLARQNASSTSLGGELAKLADRVNGTIGQVRRLATELRPGVLDKLGLPAALQWLAREHSARTSVPVELALADVAVPPALATAMFRIVQEALTNVARHADAHTVWVTLSETADAFVMTVADDGRGLADGALSRPTSLGIVGMRERAHLAGGSLTLASRPGGGLTLTVSMPRRGVPEES
ncbi:MAG: HAMP domain-containing protein [Deltaproteobacteria bacterium]|nr:HAMP domain-containing protein [Deltaproteobacteria bacterium]